MIRASESLGNLLSPKSIAIVGAAREKQKVGNIVLRNIVDGGFKGKLYPVNPKAKKIGQLTCYASYDALPSVPDLAIIAVPAMIALEMLESIAKKGTKNVVIFSAGFKEIGEEGKKLEERLKSIAEKFQMNILGPNCLGFVNNNIKLNATFGRAPEMMGNLRFISQSGALATSIFDWAEYNGVGFSEFVTLGNKAVVGENEVLGYWAKRDLSLGLSSAEERWRFFPSFAKEGTGGAVSQGLSRYRPIGLYLESIENGKEFLDIVKRITAHDPVFILKPGRSTEAQHAMQSHTGAMAGDDAILDEALKEAGVVRCEGVEDMFDLARAFAWENAPAGPNVAIVSNAGGPAVISTDIIKQEGLNVAPIDAKTHEKLTKVLPKAANMNDPIDVLGDALADRYLQAMDLVLAQKQVDALLVILTPQVMTQIKETAEAIVKMSKKHKKPIVCSFMGGSKIQEGEKVLNKYKIPSFRFPERAVRAVARMRWWNEWRRVSLPLLSKEGSERSDGGGLPSGALPRVRELINGIQTSLLTAAQAKANLTRPRSHANGIGTTSPRKGEVANGTVALSSLEANEVLKQFGINTPPTEAIAVGAHGRAPLQQAKQFAKKHGYPVVLKISSSEMLHKTEAGGVIVGIKDEAGLKNAFEKLQNTIRPRRGGVTPPLHQGGAIIQIQSQILHGIEVIVGIKRDPSFGPVLMFGAGGTMAELIQDRNLHLLPIDESAAKELIQKSKAGKLLMGYRGDKSYAVEALAKMMVQLGAIAEAMPEIKEIEINPAIVTREKVWAVDGRVILNS